MFKKFVFSLCVGAVAVAAFFSTTLIAESAKKSSQKSSHYLKEAILIIQQGDYNADVVLENLNLALELDPKNYQALMLRGVVLSQQFHFTESQRDLEEVVKHSSNWIAYYNLAYNYVLQNKFSEALKILNQAEKLEHSSYIYALRSEVYRIKGETKKQHLDAQNAIRVDKNAHNSYAQLATNFFHNRQYKSSLSNINRALGIKKEAYYYHLKGMIYNAMESWNRAINSFNQGLTLQQESAVIYLGRGLAYNGLKQYKKALADFDQAIAHGSKATGNTFKGITYYHTNNLKLAKQHLARAIADKVNNPKAYIYYGKILYQEGNHKAANDNFSKSIAINSRDPDNYADLGWFFTKHGKYTEALSYFNQALSRDKDYHHLFLGRGIVYYELGQYEQAMKDINQSIKLNNKDSRSYRARAEAHDKLGNNKQALADLKRACLLGEKSACQ